MPSALTRLRANTQLAALTQPSWLSVLSRLKWLAKFIAQSKSTAQCLMVLTLVQLNACGFHLKGHNPGADAIITNVSEISLNGPLKYSEIASAIQQEAELANINVIDSSELAITLLNVEEDNSRITGTQGGDVEQYRLKLQASWQLMLNSQKLQPQPISAQQIYDYLPANQLGNDQERQLIRAELEQQLASSILRQALAIANNPPNCDCDEAETGTTATTP